MKFSYLCLTVVGLVVAIQAHLQEPFEAPPIVSPGHEAEKWRFDIEPSPNATDNYVFETVASLLQQWPNTRYRNGHNIVPATIPTGTLLYHGTRVHEVPSVPDWVATDPEHAYLFCRNEPEEGCWQLTLAVTRPLKVLYFDGSSAAKVVGALDTQDMLAWGKVDPERIFDEFNRIKDLCQLAEKYDIDGFLRMELDFEIMLCDFSKRVEVASFLNLVPVRSLDITIRDNEEMLLLQRINAIDAGHSHNRFPGETRAKLDLTRLISLYDTEMFPSLVETRYRKERWDHRIWKLGKEDKQTLLRRLDEVTAVPSHELGSGVDWTSLIRVIVHRYSDRLEILQHLLNKTLSETHPRRDETDLRRIHQYVASMLSPYIINYVGPGNLTTVSWAAPVFEQCATTHTRVISTTLRPHLTLSEKPLLRAVEGVSHEICRVVVGIWADGVMLGFDNHSNVVRLKARPDQDISADWSRRIDWLIRWLDWSVWVKCNPQCELEETCYLPTWPWLHRAARPLLRERALKSKHADPADDGVKWDRMHGWVRGCIPGHDDDYWRRPEPRCIRRVMPLEEL